MIRPLLAVGAVAALALSTGTASAQYVYVQPAPVYVRPAPVLVAPPPVYASPGISATIQLPGLSIGGTYGSAYPYYARPYYPAPYYGGYGGYGHHHHHYYR